MLTKRLRSVTSRRAGPVAPKVLAAAAASVVVLAGCAIEKRESPIALIDETVPPPEPSVAQLSPVPPAALADTTWTVVEVIDGDILRAVPTDGSSAPVTVRLAAIDAPEIDECHFEEAVNGLRFFTNGQTVRLVPDTTDVDDFGRLVRYVETVDGIDIGEEMVRAGFAISAPVEPDTSRSDVYDLLQVDAEVNARGRWAPGVCE